MLSQFVSAFLLKMLLNNEKGVGSEKAAKACIKE